MSALVTTMSRPLSSVGAPQKIALTTVRSRKPARRSNATRRPLRAWATKRLCATISSRA